jgi:hypothetical protein
METTERSVREAALEVLNEIIEDYRQHHAQGQLFSKNWIRVHNDLETRIGKHRYFPYYSEWIEDMRQFKKELEANDPFALGFAEWWLRQIALNQLKGEF